MNENTEPNVGQRLRSIREQRGLSMRALSERCGLSTNAISMIEHGENSPTVSTLQRLANALSVNITDFFHKETKQTMVLVKRDQGLRSQSNGVLMESLGIGLFNQRLEPFRMSIQPGAGNIDDQVSHSGQEFIHCLEGEIDYSIGDRVVHLEKGDSVLFDSTQLHGYQNHSDRRTVVLIVFLAFQDLQLSHQLHLQV